MYEKLFKTVLLVSVSVVLLSGASCLGQKFRANPRGRLQERGLEGDSEDSEVSGVGLWSAEALASNPNSSFLPPPRDMLRPLIRAIRVRGEGDSDRAAELIGQFLVDATDEEYFVFTDRKNGVAYSLMAYANSLLADLPASAIEGYRLRFGIPAKHRLNQALANHSIIEIAQVMRRYLHTDAGLEAGMLIGHHHLDEGHMMLAAISFQAVLDQTEGRRRFGPELSVLTAMSWLLAGEREQAKAILRAVNESDSGGKFRFQGQAKTLRFDPEQPFLGLKELIGASELRNNALVSQWLLVGGNPSRNARRADGFPTFPAVWSAPRLPTESDKQKVIRSRDSLASTKVSSLLPAAVPLTLNGTVMVQTEKHIVGIDINSGNRIWSVPPQYDLTAGEIEAMSASTSLTDREIRDSQQLPWSDFLRGHFSSDGRLIFRISTEESAASDDEYVPRFARSSGSDDRRNRLDAVDVDRQGALVWRVGGLEGRNEPKLDGTQFLGSPLPIGDMLYVIGKRRQETVLLAINKWNGRLAWSQSLATNEDARSNRYSYRRTEDNRSLSPSYANGILLCPTGRSSIVAIDIATRSFLWGSQAKTSQTSRSGNSSRLHLSQNTQVIVDGNRVVAMDVSEYPRLLTLDLLTGRPMGRAGKTGLRLTDAFFVGCVEGDAVVVVEETRVRAISIETGRKIWETSIRSFGRPTGHGYASHSAYYLPTEENMVVKVSLADGEIVGSIRADRTLGNLVQWQGKIISVSDTDVACFDTDLGVAEQIAAAVNLAGGLDNIDPVLRVKKASLLSQSGDRKAALELLESIPVSKRPPAFERQLLTIVLESLSDLPADADDLVAKYHDRYDASLYPILHKQFVEHLVMSGNAEKAIRFLIPQDFQLPPQARRRGEFNRVIEPENKLRLSDYEFDNAGSDGEPSESTTNDSKSMIVSDGQWRRVQLLRLVINVPESTLAIKDLIDRVYAEQEFSDDTQRHRFLRSFPMELVSSGTRFQLAKSATENGEISIAENLLSSLLGYSPDNRPDLLAADSQLSGDQARYASAWQRLIDIRSQTAVGGGAKTRGMVADTNASKDVSVNQADLNDTGAANKNLPAHINRVGLSVKEINSRYDPNQVFEVQLHSQSKYRALADKSLAIWNRSTEIELYDGFNQSLCKTTVVSTQRASFQNLLSGLSQIYANHSLATIRRGSLLIGVDLSKFDDKGSQGFQCWAHTLSSSSSYPRNIAGEFDLINNGVYLQAGFQASSSLHARCCFIDSNQMVCIDAFSGETLWRRPIETNHSDLLSNDDAIISVDDRLRSATFFDWKTGFKMKSVAIPQQLETLWYVDGDEFLASNTIRGSRLSELSDVVDYRIGDEEKQKPLADDQVGTAELPNMPRDESVRFVARFSTPRGEFVWKKQFDLQAKITRLSGSRFLARTKDDQIIIFDSITGKELNRFDCDLVERKNWPLKRVGSVRVDDRDLVVFANARQSSIMDGSNRIRASRRMNTLFAGSAIAIDPETSEPLWSRPVELNGFQMLPFSPVKSPVLLLSRTVQPNQRRDPVNLNNMPQVFNVVGDIPRNAFQLVGLDWGSGKLLLNKFVGSDHGQKHVPVTYSPADGTMQISLHDYEATLSFGHSGDLPPSPPASLLSANSIPRSAKADKPLLAVNESSKTDFEKLNLRQIERAQKYEATLGDRGEAELERLRLEAE